ncbi:MAG: hypothetical protein WEC59_11025, partial [Salibacteraceae bacterium]
MLQKLKLTFCGLLILSSAFADEGFVENRGQWSEPYAFKADIPGGTVFLENNAFTFHLVDSRLVEDIHHKKAPYNSLIKHHAFKLNFIGANENIAFETKDPAHHYYNYYLGNDPSRWKTGIYPTSTVIYKNLYNGIDLLVHISGRNLKYEFHVSPGVDPNIIRMETEGIDELRIDREGNLIFENSVENLVENQPVAYQTRKDKRYEVNARFKIEGNAITYELDKHDRNLPLIIDPEIVFSSYSGSNSDNWGFTATPDKEGHLYAGGIVFGTGYPTTSGAFDVSFNQGNYDVAISKYDKEGEFLHFSTYLGDSEAEQPHSMIVNAQGNLYVMGTTGSKGFPVTSNAFEDEFIGGPPITIISDYDDGVDLFVTAFNPEGTALIGSTFLGGSNTDGLNTANSLRYNYADQYRGEITLDDDGNVYIASSTYSDDFPTSNNAFSPNRIGLQDAVVVKLTPSLNNVIWGTYLGGSSNDAAYGLDLASDNSVYVGGGTSSSTFPSSSTSLYAEYQGGRADGYIAHISNDGTSLLHSTFYGTNQYDQIYFVKLDQSDRPNLFGQTEHSNSDLIYNAQFSLSGGGQILGVLSSDLSSRIWTTQFGNFPGRPNISPTAFLVDVCNAVYISGWGGPLNQEIQNSASTVFGLPTTQDALRSN